MADLLRVRIDRDNPFVCRTPDGYLIFRTMWRYGQVAVIRPGGRLPICWTSTFDDVVKAIKADRAAKVVS